jgi:hypothetical protein
MSTTCAIVGMVLELLLEASPARALAEPSQWLMRTMAILNDTVNTGLQRRGVVT